MGQMDFSSQFASRAKLAEKGHRTKLTHFVKDCLENGSNGFLKPKGQLTASNIRKISFWTHFDTLCQSWFHVDVHGKLGTVRWYPYSIYIYEG